LTNGQPHLANNYYDMPVGEFLYWCLYYKDKAEEINRQQELNKMRNGY